MGDLHDALQTLCPIDWDDVPKTNGDLETYITNGFTSAELIVNSVPPMPDTGTAFHESNPHFSQPNTANEAKDIVASKTRAQPPHPSHADLQKHWGKPVKLSAKENPLHVALFKMAGHDRRGAWFARRSVHEGIGFGKFKAAMLREFPESLLVEGPPGAGAKRGLGAERRVEQIDLEGDGSNDKHKGRMEVYQLSAQMPPPVSPREFLTLLVSSDDVLTEKSASELPDGSKHVPRHFVIISRPTSHDDVPARSNFVRGQYESVEIIREIPLHKSPSSSSGSAENCDPEVNPVEWTMITRSDPGGGIPRFMVERGTPSAMLGDLTKFLNWACAQDEIADRDADLELQKQSSQKQSDQQLGRTSSAGGQQQQQQPSTDTESAKKTAETTAREAVAPVAVAAEQSQQPKVTETLQPPGDAQQDEPRPSSTGSGTVSNIANAVEAGITAYAPVSVSNYVSSHLHPEAQAMDLSDSDSTSDDDSYLSAEELRRLSTAPEHSSNLSPEAALTAASRENVSIASGISTPELSTPADPSSTSAHKSSSSVNLNRHDKELRKLALKREKLETDLAKKQTTEEAKFKQSQEKEQSAQDKAKEAMDKELEKAQEKHKREMEKLESKRAKEASKAEEKRRKKDDAARLSLVARERDELRGQLELWRRENGLLSSQVEALQRENTALANKLGKLGGPEVLKAVLDEVAATAAAAGPGSSSASGRFRSNTTRSGESGLTVPSSSGASTKSAKSG